VQVPITESADALNRFADAVTATASNDLPKADAALKAAVAADPNFLPGQLLAMRWFSSRGDDKATLDAARQVVALDPTNLNAARMVARAGLSSGELQPAFAAYAIILRNDPRDLEGLTNVARYAASIGDTDRFNAALARLKQLPPALVPVHPPDLVVASGRMLAAIDQYYEIEAQVPNNPSLSLKIGRLAVLRQSGEIAELELKKLQQSDPIFGYHLLRAYIVANRRNREETEAELAQAAAASVPGDDFWTSSAEVYTILGDTAKVVECLGKAAARKEPTASYILTNPLFEYLRNDAQFRQIAASLNAQQDEIRAALAQVSL
jgi:predicted Zn-dependent protease